jgi:uncharacterized membrane protein YeaQ/YmgE (transglycosylase-associated protein family)
MLLTVSLWLAGGAALGVVAWLAAPESFPAGELSCVIAGVGGAFVGGELFVVLGGPVHTHPDVLTLLGALAGALLCLDLVMQAAAGRVPIAADTRLAGVWLVLVLWSPVVFAAAIGAALARANDSPLLGAAVTAGVVVFVVCWHQYLRPLVRDR